MANNVSVSSAAIKSGIRCCQTSILELNRASKYLIQNYQKVGAGGWRDEKYRALGMIVQECNQAMEAPGKELQVCLEKLEELLKKVQKYEETNL